MNVNPAAHSRFALTLALLRAMESYRPERDRLFDDRFSQGFLPSWWKIYLLPGLRHAHAISIDSGAPGLIGGLYCRTAYIDECLNSALEKGCRQVVILGAGYDARAYRIPGLKKARLFELDLPASQRAKQARLEKILGSPPEHVTFIPIDFDRQELGSALAEGGWEPGSRSFFIWEGVTQYIQASAVDQTLEFIGRSAAAGSAVVFTFAPQGVIDGTARSPADRKIVASASQIGMPWVTGLPVGKLGEYLRDKGLELVEQVGAAEYRERLLKPRGRALSIFKTERAALAVAGAGNR